MPESSPPPPAFFVLTTPCGSLCEFLSSDQNYSPKETTLGYIDAKSPAQARKKIEEMNLPGRPELVEMRAGIPLFGSKRKKRALAEYDEIFKEKKPKKIFSFGLLTRTFIIGIVLALLTLESTRLLYGDDLFSKFPSNYSMLMATLTCLWSYTIWFSYMTKMTRDMRRGDGDKVGILSIWGIGFYYIWLLVVYPVPKVLSSDERMMALLIVHFVIHGIGFYFIRKGIEKYLKELEIQKNLHDYIDHLNND